MPPARKCRASPNADPNDGSDDGRLGGANQITEPDDRLAVGDAVEAKVLARHQPDPQLAERKRVGDEPHAVLDAMGRAVAESLGRRDAPSLILESRAAAHSWPARRREEGAFISLLGVAVSLFLCVSAAVQEGYFHRRTSERGGRSRSRSFRLTITGIRLTFYADLDLHT